MKKCTKCRDSKELSCFHKSNRAKDGLTSWCNECVKSYNKERYRTKPIHIKKRDKYLNLVSSRKPERRFSVRKAYLKRVYKISIDEYNQMFKKQNGCCEICGVHQSEIKKKLGALGVDHCHKTGQIRGLLCRKCNSGIGHLRDDEVLIEKALNYIRKYK